MKNKIIVAIGIFFIAFGVFGFGTQYGYYQPNFKLLQATELIDGEYTLMLEDHKKNRFLITVTIEKALALGVDTNEIIILTNQ